MTVSEMLTRMSSEELNYWKEFYKLEPFGAQANYLGHAITAAAVANTVPRGKSKKAFTPDDFIPKFEHKKKKQDINLAIGFAKAMTVALGGKIKDKK